MLIFGADSGPEPWPLVMILNSLPLEANRPKTEAFLAPSVGQHVRSVEGKRATCLISVANSTALEALLRFCVLQQLENVTVRIRPMIFRCAKHDFSTVELSQG